MADLTLDRPHIWKYLPDHQRNQILQEEKQSKEENQVGLASLYASNRLALL